MMFRLLPMAVGMLLLLGGNVAIASPPQGLSLNLAGGVSFPGIQGISMQGGQLALGWVMGAPVSLRSSVLHYNLDATVSGTTVIGTASFDLIVLTPHGSHTEVAGRVDIDGMTPAVLFPLGCTFGVDCSAEIPAFLNGTGLVTVTNGEVVTTMAVSVGFESPYLNPFGGPVIIASAGGEILILASYSQARIQWTGVQMGGVATGFVGSNSVDGSFGMIVDSNEDLRTGFEMDRGSIAFFGMSDPALNSLGGFVGHSTIPKGSAVQCPGFPQGTCSLTGLESSGVFTQKTAFGGAIFGKYATDWTVPAVLFSSTISASLK